MSGRLWVRTLAAGSCVALVAAAATHASGPVAFTPRAAAPTFAADIAPIVYANCTVCHRPGQAAPFSLVSYSDVRTRGQTIVDVTARRYMPPWHAARAPGFLEFRDERRLTDGQLLTFKRWVDAGMPPGNLVKAPSPPVFPSGWVLGIPDLLLTLPRPIDVPADGPDLYRNVPIAVDLPEDRWIAAIDFEPSARRVVHHALFFVGPASELVADDEVVPGLRSGLGQGLRAGSRLGAADTAWGGLGGWVPGMMPHRFPDGVAQPLPKHSNIVVQLHLHPSGKAETEDGQLALYFTKAPPTASLTGVQVPPMFGYAMGIDIPAGEPHYVIKDAFALPVDVEAYGARGHAHYLARDMRMTATLPDGSTRGLLWIKDWDFGWQDSYFFATPTRLPKQTTITVEMSYDNSADNVRNPNSPPKPVHWGRESTDEMGSMTLLIAAPSGADADLLRQAQVQHFRQQLLARLARR
jgi:hypothetical protein